MRAIATRSLRIKAAKARAALASILIIKDNSVFKNLLTQQWGTAFEFDDIDWTRQDLQQMTDASEEPICRKSFNSKIEV
jgi:hypothetical protein